jgi:aryl-alcohol dehydrogenase-like predicted oxidoreductase
MATSLVDHAGPDDPEMRRAFDRGPIGLVASYVLAGGTLTGKYTRGESGRADLDENPVIARGKRLAGAVTALASEWGVAPAHVAFAYAFQNPSLSTVLFGASSSDQLRENVSAWTTFERLDEDQLAAVRRLAETDDA